jgi:hypothetical protein
MFLFCENCSSAKTEKTEKTENKSIKEIEIDVNSKSVSTTSLQKVKEILIEKGEDIAAPNFYSYIECKDNKLYVLDYHSNPGLYVYNSKGKPLFYYNNIGEGKKQCLSILGFSLGKKNIYLSDPDKGKIAILDKKGNYIGSEKYNFQCYNICVDEDNHVVYGDNNNESSKGRAHCLFCYVKGNEAIAEKYLPIAPEAKFINASCEKSFTKVGNEIHYYTGLRDTIYSININGARPVYHLNFGNAWPTKEFISEAKNNLVNFFSKMRNTDYVSDVSYFESENILIVSFIKKGDCFAFIYDKNSGKSILQKIEKGNSLVGINGDNLLITRKSFNGDKIIEYKVMWSNN